MTDPNVPDHCRIGGLLRRDGECAGGTTDQRGKGPEQRPRNVGKGGGPNGAELVGVCLDPVLSVLAELSRREPELCAQSLQTLLQLIQKMEFRSMAGQPRGMLAGMLGLLRELRREGNAQVSAGANSCMMVRGKLIRWEKKC